MRAWYHGRSAGHRRADAGRLRHAPARRDASGCPRASTASRCSTSARPTASFPSTSSASAPRASSRWTCRDVTDHDAPAWYLGAAAARSSARPELADLDHDEVHGGFEVARRACCVRASSACCAAPSTCPVALDGRFDLVFCCNVLIQHRDPVALARGAGERCSRRAACSCSPRPSTSPSRRRLRALLGDLARAAWWVPSRGALVDFAACAASPRSSLDGRFPVPTTPSPTERGSWAWCTRGSHSARCSLPVRPRAPLRAS